jgi:hypothetical protein
MFSVLLDIAGQWKLGTPKFVFEKRLSQSSDDRQQTSEIMVIIVSTTHFNAKNRLKNDMSTLRLFALMLVLVFPAILHAQELAAPSGEIVLTIEGNIDNGQSAGRAEFDMAMLRALPSVTIRTTTPWTTGTTEFTGISMAVLLDLVGARGSGIRAEALNDYIARVDLETVRNSGAILAYMSAGNPLSVRDKGPLWIMFPFDDRPELKAEAVYSQSVWQLRKLIIEE